MPSYDYIFTGAGAAALSLLTRMVESGAFSNKRILLIDRAVKNQNDRTWCFWEKGTGYFEHLVYRKWDQLSFHCSEYSKNLDNHPYQYKMIRGIDFYNYCFEKIDKHPAVEKLYGEVQLTATPGTNPTLLVNGNPVDTSNATIFNSIYLTSDNGKKDINFLQHFKGWIINTHEKRFDPQKATLMDFRVHQQHGASFVYVLPLSENRLLVEYTLFTPSLLSSGQYDLELKKYIKEFLHVDTYEIEDEEFGIIPMTSAKFRFADEGYYNIGTAGGQTKASTGYTFQFIQKQADQIINQLTKGQSVNTLNSTAGRFHFYDKVLLRVLADEKLTGEKVFSRLFAKNSAAAIFKFLDNESNLREEIRIMASLQFFPFLSAGWKSIT